MMECGRKRRNTHGASKTRANAYASARYCAYVSHHEIVLRDDVPGRTGVAADAGRRCDGRAVHQPDAGLAVVMLEQHVGLAVAVDVEGADHVPRRPWVGADGGGREHYRAVHQPDANRAVVVLPE